MADEQKIQAAYDRAKQDLSMRTWVCGTTMCLGGAAMLNAGWHVVIESLNTHVGWRHEGKELYVGNGQTTTILKDELDLTREQTGVFHMHDWPSNIRRVYYNDKDRVLALRMAIKHFTGVEVKP